MDSSRPRLCAIYLKDLLQFSAPNLIHECRQVSSYYDALISNIPIGRLPKRRYTGEMCLGSVSDFLVYYL